MAKKGLMIEYTRDELKAYLLHERGHFDILGRLMSMVYALIVVFIFFFIYLVVLFITRNEYDFLIKTILFILAFLFLGLVLNYTREYYADYYSWSHCSKNALIAALKKIDKYKRSSLWKSMIRNYTHPPLNSRIMLIGKTKA